MIFLAAFFPISITNAAVQQVFSCLCKQKIWKGNRQKKHSGKQGDMVCGNCCNAAFSLYAWNIVWRRIGLSSPAGVPKCKPLKASSPPSSKANRSIPWSWRKPRRSWLGSKPCSAPSLTISIKGREPETKNHAEAWFFVGECKAQPGSILVGIAKARAGATKQCCSTARSPRP